MAVQSEVERAKAEPDEVVVFKLGCKGKKLNPKLPPKVQKPSKSGANNANNHFERIDKQRSDEQNEKKQNEDLNQEVPEDDNDNELSKTAKNIW